jgi:hypothetical protein
MVSCEAESEALIHDPENHPILPHSQVVAGTMIVADGEELPQVSALKRLAWLLAQIRPFEMQRVFQAVANLPEQPLRNQKMMRAHRSQR